MNIIAYNLCDVNASTRIDIQNINHSYISVTNDIEYL